MMNIYEVAAIDGIKITLKSNENEKNVFISIFAEAKLEVGDRVKISEKLLDERSDEYIGDYTFGDLDSRYGYDVKDEESEELLFITKKEGKEIKLKRIYG